MSDHDLKVERDLNLLGPLLEEIKRFEKAQNSYANFGACDTEPDGEWQFILSQAAQGLKYPGHRTPDDWQLFTGMRGVGLAAHRLTAVAKMAHEKIADWRMNFPAGQWREFDRYLRDYCWRIRDWGDNW